MIIQLERVTFNHDPAGNTVDAMNIRIDRDTPAPDWVRGVTTPSLAAYDLSTTKGNTLTIHAQFSFPGPPNAPGTSVSVRAQPVNAGNAPLGSVVSTPVAMPAAGATTAPIVFKLKDPGFRNTGTGRYPMAWQWQVRLTPNGTWLDFARSDHIVYVTLAVPGAPWTQTTAPPQQVLWPWTRVLDWACAWAQGVQPGSTAAGKAAGFVEQNLYALGNRTSSPLVYDDDSTFSVLGVFFCTDFLKAALEGGSTGAPVIVNCTDCASALAVFANALGCGLDIMSVVPTDRPNFITNPILPIGATSPVQPSWGVHTFAVRPAVARSSRHVHDACLRIDRDSNPVSKPSKFGVSNGLAFGSVAAAISGGRFKYVHRLIRPADVAHCGPTDEQLPDIDERAPTDSVPATIVVKWAQYRKQIDLIVPDVEDDTSPVVSLEPMQIPGFLAYDQVKSPLHFSLPRGLVNPSVELFYVSTRPADSKQKSARDGWLRVSIGYADSQDHARDALAWLMTQSAATPAALRAEDGPRIGDAAFASSRHTTALFVRGRAVARIKSVGRNPVPVLGIARVVEAALQPHANDALRPRH